MTPTAARSALRSLAVGLPNDDSGARRLFERIAHHDEHETLRSTLAEIGARALLDCARDPFA